MTEKNRGLNEHGMNRMNRVRASYIKKIKRDGKIIQNRNVGKKEIKGKKGNMTTSGGVRFDFKGRIRRRGSKIDKMFDAVTSLIIGKKSASNDGELMIIIRRIRERKKCIGIMPNTSINEKKPLKIKRENT
jgi:hypothetical protein